jgi:hypothetical protein
MLGRAIQLALLMPLSAPGQLFHGFGIAFALKADFPRGALDVAEIVQRQDDMRYADVFFEAMQLRRAGDRHDPWLLRQQPQRDLRPRRGQPRPSPTSNDTRT